MSEQSLTTAGKDRPRIRWIVRAAVLTIAIALLWPMPALSPFIAVMSLLAMRTFHTMALLGLVIGCVVLVHPRWFCRWLCPLGLCAEGAGRLGRHWGRRPVKSIPVGQWILWLTLGGAILGWPLLIWLDPLAIFTGLLGLKMIGSIPGAWLAALPALAVLLLSLAWPSIWCGQLCPLGAMQDLLSRPVKLWRRRTAPTSESGPPLARRAILGAAIGAAAASTLRASGTAPVRPPGAVDEREFLAVCVRCGNCVRACPTQIIQPDLGGHGWASFLTPTLSFERDYCRDNCALCTRVCPSGALTRFIWKGSKRYIRMGLAKVDMNVCLLREDRECSECRRWCPYDAIRYVFSETEYCLTPQIDPEKCNGCGACEMACPVKPKKAIVVVPLD